MNTFIFIVMIIYYKHNYLFIQEWRVIFIEKRIIDFSKVQIYIYDLDLIEKMNVDY